MKEKTLSEKLIEYSKSDAYAFHMPGHKRQVAAALNPYQIDITEIDGFDDLHHPDEEGVLTQAQEYAAHLYHSEETHFLVNGSTSGIQAALAACAGEGRFLIARNCHRSVFHMVDLLGAKADYIYPQCEDNLWINGSILAKDVEEYFKNNAKQDTICDAVMITSPTYDGVCSDVKAIADVCHRYGVPLIVDQAHGAHFPFDERFPSDAIADGADLVIHSVHKTLPCLTQTALLHVNGCLVDRGGLRYYLSVFQTSSPSYVLMSSIESGLNIVESSGAYLYEELFRNLSDFYEKTKDLKHFHVLRRGEFPDSIFDFDESKIIIGAEPGCAPGIAGKLAEILRERYHVETEMTACTYVCGIASLMDTKEGIDRLSSALIEIDKEINDEIEHEIKTGISGEGISEDGISEEKSRSRLRMEIPKAQVRMTMAEARCQQKKNRKLRMTDQVLLEESCGLIAGSFVYLYPPGIPILAPGEEITEDVLKQIADWKLCGMEVHGLSGVAADRIRIVAGNE